MGTEAVGVSYELLTNADICVYLPLYGFADSLNLSVATALIVQWILLHQPKLDGFMDETERQHLRQLWYPKLCQQRLLSAREKKRYKQLHKLIENCLLLQSKKDAYIKQQQQDELVQQSNNRTSTDRALLLKPLTTEQEDKIKKLTEYQNELQQLESKQQVSYDIVQEWIQNPPEPLTDLRRADPHRITFAGKNTKKLHEQHWDQLPGTTKFVSTKYSTADTFRSRINK